MAVLTVTLAIALFQAVIAVPTSWDYGQTEPVEQEKGEILDMDTLREICKSGDVKAVKSLIKSHGKAAVVTKECLFESVHAKGAELTEFLLNKGANPNTMIDEYWTPLLNAVYFENAHAVFLLIKHGASPNEDPYDTGMTPLFYATTALVAEILIDSGANIESQMKGEEMKGFTPLMYAIYNHELDVITELVARKANLEPAKKSDWLVDDLKDPQIQNAIKQGEMLRG